MTPSWPNSELPLQHHKLGIKKGPHVLLVLPISDLILCHRMYYYYQLCLVLHQRWFNITDGHFDIKVLGLFGLHRKCIKT